MEHAFEDALPLVPFLFLTYLVLEVLEHMAGERVNAAVKRAGAAGPVVGALLGVVPQCGFSAMAATLYAGRVVTLGTLVAVFLSTSDEMLPLLVAERVDAGFLVQVLGLKAAIAAVAGLGIDALLAMLRRNARVRTMLQRRVLGTASAGGAAPTGAAGSSLEDEPDLIDELAEAGEGLDHIHRLCARDHCGCDDAMLVRRGHDFAHGSQRDAASKAALDPNDHAHGHDHTHAHGVTATTVLPIVKSAFVHTVQVSVFIYLITLVLVALLETVGEPALEAFLRSNEVLAIFAAALVGLIPNCAASVVVTQLYLEGMLSLGAMFAGTLAGAGAGFLVLFRTNRSARENIVILCMLYVIAIICGFVAMVI